MDRVVNYVGGVTPGYNLGDEALYKVDKEIFANYPFQFSRIISPFRQQHSQTTIVGGGTVLPVIAMLMRPVKYAYVFGAGVLHPAWNGPFSRDVIDRFKLIDFRFISVRGNISKSLLKDWGIDSEVIGDPCLSLRPKKVLKKINNRVAINVGIASQKYSWGNRDRVLGELAKVCEVLKNRGYEVILIPFWQRSLTDIEMLSNKTGVKVFRNWQDLDETINLLSTSKV
jgi:hypothetical protein